ncbi:hypothetical protein [Denitrobaculum tricleocarpae]|nr:hypothetical protein [Denitrobaculum tricleocarpae]
MSWFFHPTLAPDLPIFEKLRRQGLSIRQTQWRKAQSANQGVAATAS